MSRRKGFTLMELIIVVIIIGVLATFAVPQYLKAVERTKQAKARHNLSLIAQAEKMVRADTDTYVNVADGGYAVAFVNYVELAEVDNDVDWDYAVTGSSASVFIATAVRNAGPNSTETIILNEAGVWSGTFTP